MKELHLSGPGGLQVNLHRADHQKLPQHQNRKRLLLTSHNDVNYNEDRIQEDISSRIF